jgi:hypothetical protein
MGDLLEGNILDYVRRAGKEIVCCLLPDELPFFDVIWQAIEPMLKSPSSNRAKKPDFFHLLKAEYGGRALAAAWSKDADILTPNVMQVLNNALRDAINSDFCTADPVADLVARQSLKWPIPDRFSGMIALFVEQFCNAAARPDKETEELLQGAHSSIRHSTCYIVFHHGRKHFYQTELPKEILDLREKVLFWIDRANNDFRSCNRKQRPLRPQTERVLQFICSEQNNGRIVSFSELYSWVWRKDPPSDEKKMEASVMGEMSALNIFTGHQFEHSTDYNAWVLRYDKKYRIKENMPNECCIVRTVSLPD